MDDFENLFGIEPLDDELHGEEVEQEVTTETEPETVDEVETPEPETEVEEASDDADLIEGKPETVIETPDAEAPQTVPVSVMIQQREARKAAEQEAALLRAQLAKLQQSQVAPADPYDDPEGFRQQQAEHVQATIRAEMAMARFEDSLTRGREKYGQEALEELGDWVDQQIALDPSFEERAMLQSDPVEWSVAERNRRNRLADFEADETAYVARRAAELGLTGVNAPAQPTVSTEPRKEFSGPKSLVHARTRDTNVSTTGKDEFGALFDK